MNKLRGLCFLLLLAALVPASAEAQPAFQVKDLNTTRSEGIDEGRFFPDDGIVSLGGWVLFRASDGIHGVELWMSDAEGSTRMIADLCPGFCSSSPEGLTVVHEPGAGPWIYFLAHGSTDPGFSNGELWKSNGLPAGTVLIKDLFPEGESGRAEILGSARGLLFFSIARVGHRRELWRSDGTAAGTFLLAEIETYLTNGPFEWIESSNWFLMIVHDVDHGREIWTSDGTVEGTGLLKDIAPGPASGYSDSAAMLENGRLLFTATGPEGTELWATRGTEASTVLVQDIMPGPDSSFPRDLTVLNGEAFFFATPDTVNHPLDRQLFRSDGTAAGTGPVGPVPSNAFRMTAAGGRLYFLAGCTLWTSDATAAGTLPVKDFTYASSNGQECGVPLLTQGHDELFFTVADAAHGREPWKSNGTPAGTALIADIRPGPASSLTSLSLLHSDGLWYFRATVDDQVGPQMWVTDGTNAWMLHWINPQRSGFKLSPQGRLTGPRAYFDLDGTLLFQGDDGTTGAELWKSDGTAAGTSLVKDLWSFPGWNPPSWPGEFTRAGDTLFFRAGAGTGLEELWKTDGTPEGTQQLLSIGHLHNFGVFGPRDLAAAGDRLLFATASFDEFQEELWRSDGTPEGTAPILQASGNPIYPTDSTLSLGNVALFRAVAWESNRLELWRSDGTEAGTAPLGIPLPFRKELRDASTLRDGVLFFATSTPEHGEELWQSDGTEEGTFLLAETVAGPGSQPLGPFATAGATVFFAAGGDELWKNDAGGTAIVRALPGNPSTGIRSLTAVGDRVYFSYDDVTHGRELWVSDGTEEGTRMVEDLFPGPGSSHPRELQAQGSILVFTAFDGVHGVEPWRSNGTELGTRILQDIAPGALPSSPTEFTASGSNLYFAATDGTTGFELWALPRTALLSTFVDVPAGAWYWSFVEALAASGLTRGCAQDRYCPGLGTTRAEAAVFLMRGLSLTQPPPPPGTAVQFEDVPPSHWAWSWITQFAAQGYTNGCSPNRYCPDSPLLRAEAAVFLLRVKHGADYVPPPATGTRFEDVPASHWAAAWIEQLAAEQITLGCAVNRFCPGQTVTRAEMAAFLVRTFGLATI